VGRRKRSLAPNAPPLSPLHPPAERLPRLWIVTTALLVCAYLGLTVGHIYTTPVLPVNAGSFINAPDERAHLIYVRAIAYGGRAPMQRDAEFPTYQWHQPPLYYALASFFYAGGDRAVRWFSLLCGLATLCILFRSVRRLFPEEPVLAALAMGFAALLPMRQAITGSVGNDALIELLFSLTLLYLIEAFRGGFTLRRAGAIGAVVGAALLTKASGLLLLPVVAAALFLLWKEGESLKAVWQGGVALLAVTATLILPWYARNYQLYGELTPVKGFLREFEGTSKASDWIGKRMLAVDVWSGEIRQSDTPMTRAGYLNLVANWTFRTFWASYTPPRLAAMGIPQFLPAPFYLLYGLATLAAGIGLIRLHFRQRAELTKRQRFLIYLFLLTIALVLLSFTGFIWTFFQAQGRYLYPAMLPLSLLFALGIRSLSPVKYRDLISLAVLALLLIMAAAFLFTAVIPVYS
jgi:4-amino-4-deoxy-L-arabinose transferase-like glycosyltransferase